ncbi:hypothetical protein V6N12_065103 [Hibiscus sabdariffa]|uniref:Uncharacterized protein n=1 Tax=Hibiscus sabdariffa TaxID=183260 RepID=A0ABR2G7S0_9ROSI
MSRRLEALVYYDGQMLSDPSFGVVFQASNTVTFKISRQTTFEMLNERICKKAPHGRGRQLQAIKYRLPTSLEPLTYSVFHVGDDGDVLMMLETHSQYSFGGPIELLATFSDGESECSNHVPNWVQANFDFDPNAQSPTAGLRQDFNLLNTSYDEGGSSSYSAMHRHSCVASFDFDLNMPPTQHSTYNPYSVEPGRSSSYHEARSPYDHEMFNPFDDYTSGRHSMYIPSSRNVDEYSQQSRQQFVPQQSHASHRETVMDEADLFRFTDAPRDEEPIMELGPEGDEMGLLNDEPDDIVEPNSADMMSRSNSPSPNIGVQRATAQVRRVFSMCHPISQQLTTKPSTRMNFRMFLS